MASECPMPRRPVRATALTFGVLAVLFAVCSPLVDVSDPVTFFAGGLAYSLFLALCSVGLALAAAGRLVRWWLLSAPIPLSVIAGVWLWLNSHPQSLLAIPSAVWRGLLGVIIVWLAAGCLVAGLGWIGYIRECHSAGRV